MKKTTSLPFPILISREALWYVAECPMLGIATQGKTEKEVKGNIRDLIAEYLEDPDTQKPHAHALDSTSLTYVAVPVPTAFAYGKF